MHWASCSFKNSIHTNMNFYYYFPQFPIPHTRHAQLWRKKISLRKDEKGLGIYSWYYYSMGSVQSMVCRDCDTRSSIIVTSFCVVLVKNLEVKNYNISWHIFFTTEFDLNSIFLFLLINTPNTKLLLSALIKA